MATLLSITALSIGYRGSVFADEHHAVRQLSIGRKESLPQGINPADHLVAAEPLVFPGLPCFKLLSILSAGPTGPIP